MAAVFAIFLKTGCQPPAYLQLTYSGFCETNHIYTKDQLQPKEAHSCRPRRKGCAHPDGSSRTPPPHLPAADRRSWDTAPSGWSGTSLTAWILPHQLPRRSDKNKCTMFSCFSTASFVAEEKTINEVKGRRVSTRTYIWEREIKVCFEDDDGDDYLVISFD